MMWGQSGQFDWSSKKILSVGHLDWFTDLLSFRAHWLHPILITWPGTLRSMAISSEEKMRNPLYLEDLSPGQRFTSRTYRVEAEEIRAFAKQFDPQPFHLDEESAKTSLFSGLAASGWHTAAITMRLTVETGLPLAGGIIGVGGEISWHRPTRPGDTLHVESEILEVTPSRSRPDRGIVTVRNETRNQLNEVVQTFTAKLFVPRRPVPTTPNIRDNLGRQGPPKNES
jgi:acyl dehydratase